jgi:HK97 family phage major capsid protein
MTRTRIPNIVTAVTSTPWAILPEKLQAIVAFLQERSEGVELSADEVMARIGAGPRDNGARQQGVIAVLPLYGVLSHRMNVPRAISEPGGTSTEKFGVAFDKMVRDPNVSAIVIDIDSPGGTVSGTQELWQKIFSARGKKPIIAVANSLAASAAYFVASACDEIVVSPSAEVGSIGVYMVHEDLSGFLEQAGIKQTVIKAGKFKAEGYPSEPLSDEARAAFQLRVDDAYDQFVKAVAKARGVKVADVRNGFGEGRVVTAKRAVELGMADRVATLEQVIAKLGGDTTAIDTSSDDTGDQNIAAADTAPDLAADVVGSITTRNRGSQTVLEIVGDLSDVHLRAALDRTVASLGSRSIPIVHAPDGAGARVAVVSPSSPAPKAKEHTVPEGINTSAADIGAADIEAARKDTAKVASQRIDDILALCESHEIPLAKAKDFALSGKSADAVGREILELKRAGNRPAAISVGNDRATERPWESFGHFATSVMQAYDPARTQAMDPRLFAAAQGMNQAVPSEGGMLVPPQFSTKIWDEMNGAPDNLLSLTDSYPVDGESITFNANAETSRANGSRYGGVRGYWINEADQITKSKPKFRQLRLEPKELAVLVYVTEKNLRNSAVALQTYLQRAAGDEINFLVADAIIRGPGAGQPLGLLNAGSTVTVNKETSQATATFQQENISKMWQRLHPRARAGAVWLMNPDVEPALDTLNSVVKNVAGTENVGGYANKVYDAEKGTLKGRPVKFIEQCETLGTKGDVILWAPQWYATGVRSGGIAEAMSMHLRFDYAEMAFRFMFAADGQPWLADALTPFKGTNTLTSQVVLQAR